MSSGRQFLLQAESEMQRNEWIAHVNYASAFKTAGIRMRLGSISDTAAVTTRRTILSSSSLGEGNCDNQPRSPRRSSVSQSPSSVTRASMDSEPGVQSRSRIVLSKIRELESKIKTTREQLNSEIRVVRNIAVLTPFQRSTRDRLQNSVVSLARRVRQLRLEIVRLTCYRDVLQADLASEERHQKRSRMSLQLDDHPRSKESSPVPRMTLSVYDDNAAMDMSRQSSSRSDLSHGNGDSSICESFHSALDFSADWPVDSSTSTSPKARTTNSFEANSPLPSAIEASPGGYSLLSPASPSGADLSSSSILPVQETSQPEGEEVESREDDDSPDFHNADEEQAEDWDKTRAGRRVSLVRLPVSLRNRPT